MAIWAVLGSASQQCFQKWMEYMKEYCRLVVCFNVDFITGYCFQSVHMDEKEEACRALSEIAKNCG
jgi:hypothetical protein